MEDSEFWTAREALKHIHENSASNFASPWHILALAIEGALQQIPYDTKVQTNRIYGLTPNFAAILYGRSGSGKSRSEEHTSELQSLMRISYAVFCLKKKNNTRKTKNMTQITRT